MDEAILLTNKSYLLQKSPKKGGWTFVAIPEISQDKKSWFGQIKVKGSIDSYEFSNVHLMPMGNGMLFLPVKAEIRKEIGKQVGDWVHLILYSQELPPINKDDFMLCLADEPKALNKFNSLSKTEQKKITDWIYSVKNDQTRVERIAESIDRLLI